jgi:phosphohistidine phosphatase
LNLYLVRHGEALSKDLDPERGLSDRGREDARETGRLLKDQGVKVTDIRSSQKARARQTAEIIASQLGNTTGVRQVDGLAPNDPADPIAREMETAREDVMLVGHLPFLPTLAMRLLATGQLPEEVFFPTAGVLVLGRDQDGIWEIKNRIEPVLT